MTLATAPDLHDAAWHEARRHGVGGSDIPILAGLSTYHRGIHDLYLEKIGEVAPAPSSPAMEVGSVIEDAIAILYSRRTGKAVTRANVPARHPDYPWAIGNLDRKVRGERRLVEIKNRRMLSKAEGLPADVECQVQWYLGVTRYPVADVAILVGGNDLRIVEVLADEAYFRDLLVIGGDFMRRVDRREPPDIDGSDAAARYLAATYPWHRGEDLVPATPDLEALSGELGAAKVALREAAGRVGTAENAIKALLGESPGVQGDGWKITWKRSAGHTKTDWKAVAAEVIADFSPAVRERIVARHAVPVAGSRRFVTYGLDIEEVSE